MEIFKNNIISILKELKDKINHFGIELEPIK